MIFQIPKNVNVWTVTSPITIQRYGENNDSIMATNVPIKTSSDRGPRPQSTPMDF
jgi:hypothetical protein